MNSTGKKIYRVQLEPDERKHLKEILDVPRRVQGGTDDGLPDHAGEARGS